MPDAHAHADHAGETVHYADVLIAGKPAGPRAPDGYPPMIAPHFSASLPPKTGGGEKAPPIPLEQLFENGKLRVVESVVNGTVKQQLPSGVYDALNSPSSDFSKLRTLEVNKDLMTVLLGVGQKTVNGVTEVTAKRTVDQVMKLLHELKESGKVNIVMSTDALQPTASEANIYKDLKAALKEFEIPIYAAIKRGGRNG